MTIHLRLAEPRDCVQLAPMLALLWPDSDAEEHAQDLRPKLRGEHPGAMPVVVLVAETEDALLVGFMEAGLRSHADGCDPSRPVGYVEGWYVVEDFRKQGVGKRLLEMAEQWARSQGCVEMASDTWIDHEVSQRVHEALGFTVADRCVLYRKRL